MKPCFVYAYGDSNAAFATNSRCDRNCVLLFTCPENWRPLTQEAFEKAAIFYKVREPHRFRYEADDIPF